LHKIPYNSHRNIEHTIKVIENFINKLAMYTFNDTERSAQDDLKQCLLSLNTYAILN